MPLPPNVEIAIDRHEAGQLVISDAALLAELFFRLDPSSSGDQSYDARKLVTASDEIDADDLAAINKTFRARSSKEAWTGAIDAGPLDWLAVVPSDIDLADVTNDDWQQTRVVLEQAFSALLVKDGCGPSVASKMLHLKRPMLVPVFDSVVVGALGLPSLSTKSPKQLERLMNAYDLLRQVVVGSKTELDQVREHLASVGIARSRVRILDALIWCSASTGWSDMPPALAAWRVG